MIRDQEPDLILDEAQLATELLPLQQQDQDQPAVILVTGASGLVGKAIEHVVTTSQDPRFGKREGETWVFVGSRDADLR
jgi:uncharacterized protein YgbK (DUF1537 family)